MVQFACKFIVAYLHIEFKKYYQHLQSVNV